MNATQPAGNFYDKYRTRNPVARALMAGFLNAFDDLLTHSQGAASALEVGCGEGELSIRIARTVAQVTAFDISPQIVEEAKRRTMAAGVTVKLRSDSVFNLNPERDSADLVVCCEVLEHIDDPMLALDKLHGVCRKHFLTSVPREPVWRSMNLMRGRYLRELGNTPGHVQHWSKADFLDLLDNRFRVVEVRTPLPWTMALCEPRR